MTAKELNRLYECYNTAPGHLTLSDLLQGVKEYAVKKFYRDLDKQDIAQECVIRAWKSVDSTAKGALSPFDPKQSSFSTWIARVCVTTSLNYQRDKKLLETSVEDEDLERLSFEYTDPWHSEGREWSGALPTEGYYYEKEDPNCKIPLGKSAWDE